MKPSLGLCILVLVFGMFLPALAQKNNPNYSLTGRNLKEVEQEISSLSLNPTKEEIEKIEGKKYPPRLPFYLRKPQGLELDNFCAEDVMKEFGIRYVFIPKTQTDMRPAKTGWLNLGTRFKMFFRKGPGWQKKLQKRIRDCAKMLIGNTSD